MTSSLWPREGRNWQAPPLTRRALLECVSGGELADRMRTMDGPAVGSVLVIDPAGRIRNIEVLPQALTVISREAGVFVHTNHCLDPGVAMHEVERLPSPGSPGRCARMQALMDAAVAHIGAEGIRRMLDDHAGRPEAICRHARTATEQETTPAPIAEPVARMLHLSFGPPCEGRFATYRIA